MISDRIEAKWITAFEEIFQACKAGRDETAVILSESQSRDLNVHLAELALARMGVTFYHLRVPTPRSTAPAILRSTGTALCLTGQDKAVAALAAADFVVDMTLEGLMHTRETRRILRGGARILNVSNEHPDALERMRPDDSLKARTLDAVRTCRQAQVMTVTSGAGTDLTVNMAGNTSVGVWGWTDRPGTLAHWPGGIVVSFPAAGSVNGRLVFQPGDMNLTFKRYFDTEVSFTVKDDYVTAVEGKGADARLMRDYLSAFGDKEAYATSHVGWGLNRAARYEALTMYSARDTNCTELRAVAGNCLYSTGANEFAGRFTRGHFDLPMMGCTIAVDGIAVVEQGFLL
ncbi:MAG: peptidase M29 [Rhodobacteraceae bacterium]|nr:peptidase M29 [Paracoccaceae bacterium]